MTVQYSNSFGLLLMGKGFLYAFNPIIQPTSFPSAITIYAGGQPTAAQVTANWVGNYDSSNANFLAHFSNAGWTQPSYGPLVQLSVPSPVTATNTGAAAWAIVWQGNIALGSMAGALPSTVFAVVPVTLDTDVGVIRLQNLSIVAAATATIYDGSFGGTSP